MNMNKLAKILTVAVMMLLSCTAEIELNKNTECEIVAFSVNGVQYEIIGSIITHTYPLTAVETWLGLPVWPVSPEIIVSRGATISPDPSIPQYFENEVFYTVTAEDGKSTRKYVVRVVREPDLPIDQ